MSDEDDLIDPTADEPLDEEEIEASADGADEEEELEVEAAEDDEAEEGAATEGRRRAAAAAAEDEESASIAARRAVRDKLAADVEAFLKKGGKIETIPEDVRADPPKKPENKYGSRSI